MTKDPVCLMDVEVQAAAGSSSHEGTTYYFCSANCKMEFDKDPERFVRRTDILGRTVPPK